MNDRAPVSCLHPNCSFRVKRGQSCCGWHYADLTDDLRNRLLRAKGVEELGAVKVEIREYFESRMIGRHERRRCKGRDCAADVVWFGKMPVDVAGVEASDLAYDAKKHVSHFATCPNAGEFRRKREPGGEVPQHYTERYYD